MAQHSENIRATSKGSDQTARMLGWQTARLRRLA